MILKPPRIASIHDVVKHQLCISCGACASAAPENAISMELDSTQGIFVPRIMDQQTVTGCGTEFAVCPGRGIPIEELSRMLFGEDLPSSPELGRYRLALAAHTTDEALLENASSGGVMTDIALFLLEKNLVDGVTSVKFEKGSDGPRTHSYIARNRNELIQAQGSKYCPTSTNLLVRSCQKAGGKYLFIGTPCQVAAVRMAVRERPELAETFPYTMGNFCGGYRDFRYLDGMLQFSKVRPSDVVSFRFRGGGWPGSMRAKTQDGRVVSQPYPHYRSRAFVNKQRRCSLCIDGTALLADFACGDAWMDRFANTRHGWSIILARSAFARVILQEMIACERLASQEISRDEILYSQRFNLDSKINRQKKRRAVYRFLGLACPEFDVPLPRGRTSYHKELKILLLKSAFVARGLLAVIRSRCLAAGKSIVECVKRPFR